MTQYRNQGIAEVSIAPPVKAFISQRRWYELSYLLEKWYNYIACDR